MSFPCSRKGGSELALAKESQKKTQRIRRKGRQSCAHTLACCQHRLMLMGMIKGERNDRGL